MEHTFSCYIGLITFTTFYTLSFFFVTKFFNSCLRAITFTTAYSNKAANTNTKQEHIQTSTALIKNFKLDMGVIKIDSDKKKTKNL